MATTGFVLVTGANGYLGARTVAALLDAGFRVRGTVRSLKHGDDLVKALAQHSDRLEIVEVPDITVDGAFDASLKGITHVAHLASPVALDFKDPAPIIHTAEASTKTILVSAAKEATVKSFVLMSSFVAVRSGNEEPGHVFTEADWNEVALPWALREGKATPGPITYTASKVASEKAFWAFVEEAKPAFKAAAINPVFIYGPPLTVPHSREQVGFTYRHIFDISAGSQIPEPALGFPWFVDVRDVARLVVFAIENPDKTNGQRYIAAKAYAPPQAVADVLRKRLPERKHIIAEGKPGEGYIAGYTAPPDLGYDIDTSKSEIETGVPYIDFETSVLDTVEALKSLW